MKFPFFKKKWGDKGKEKIENDEKKEIVENEKLIIDKAEKHAVVPILTEKNNLLARQNIYVFKAQKHLNKNQLKGIISRMFGVKIVKLNIINYQKRTRGRARLKNVRPEFKKVFVKLAPGQKISIFE